MVLVEKKIVICKFIYIPRGWQENVLTFCKRVCDWVSDLRKMAEHPGVDLQGRGVPSSSVIAPSATLVQLVPHPCQLWPQGRATCQWTCAWRWPARSCVPSLLYFFFFYEKRDQILTLKKNPNTPKNPKPKNKWSLITLLSRLFQAYEKHLLVNNTNKDPASRNTAVLKWTPVYLAAKRAMLTCLMNHIDLGVVTPAP